MSSYKDPDELLKLFNDKMDYLKLQVKSIWNINHNFVYKLHLKEATESSLGSYVRFVMQKVSNEKKNKKILIPKHGWTGLTEYKFPGMPFDENVVTMTVQKVKEDANAMANWTYKLVTAIPGECGPYWVREISKAPDFIWEFWELGEDSFLPDAVFFDPKSRDPNRSVAIAQLLLDQAYVLVPKSSADVFASMFSSIITNPHCANTVWFSHGKEFTLFGLPYKCKTASPYHFLLAVLEVLQVYPKPDAAAPFFWSVEESWRRTTNDWFRDILAKAPSPWPWPPFGYPMGPCPCCGEAKSGEGEDKEAEEEEKSEAAPVVTSNRDRARKRNKKKAAKR